MREYARLSPTFWTGGTGKELRGLDPEVKVLALYLLSAPGSNMLGLYYLPLPVIAHECGQSIEVTERGLATLAGLGFAEYDPESEFVWVIEMARWQVLGRSVALKPSDKRVAGVSRELQQLSRNPFTARFCDKYRDALRLEAPPTPSSEKDLASPFDGPSDGFEGPSKGMNDAREPLGRVNHKEKEKEKEKENREGEGEGEGKDPGAGGTPDTEVEPPGAVPDPDPPPDDPPPPQALIALFRELRLQIRPKLGHYVGSTADDEAATRLLRVLSQLHGWVEGMALFRKVAGTYIRESRSTTPTFGKLEHDFDYWREQTTTDPAAGPDPTRYGDPDSQRERNQRLLADAAEATQETTP